MLLPATMKEVLDEVVKPALKPLPEQMQSYLGKVELLAIGGIESGFRCRSQYNHGPARGMWMFESSGVIEVMTNKHTCDLAVKVCKLSGVPAKSSAVYAMLSKDDLLACRFARLLLWTDPRPLPITEQEGWSYYIRGWEPGKPRELDWPVNYDMAVAAALRGE